MAGSDRTQWKQCVVGELGANRNVSNAALAVAQDAQRFASAFVGTANLGATSNFTFPVAFLDRPVLIKSCYILPGNSLTFAAGNFVTVQYGYTNANGGAMTVQGAINSSNTVANGSTGNWTTGIPIQVTANTAVNQVVPSGSLLQVQSLTNGAAGVVVPGGTSFQLILEEV